MMVIIKDILIVKQEIIKNLPEFNLFDFLRRFSASLFGV